LTSRAAFMPILFSPLRPSRRTLVTTCTRRHWIGCGPWVGGVCRSRRRSRARETFAAAELEQDALQNASSFAAMLGVLGILGMGARWRTASFANSEAALAAFEDEATERLVTLDVWDTRFASSSAGRPTGRSLPPRIWTT
jgi:hypothetical protein